MKVLYVCKGTNAGGIERALINTLNKINYNECSVDLLLWNPPGQLYPLINKNVNIIDTSDVGIIGRHNFNKYPLKKRLKIMIRYIKARVIYLFGGNTWKVCKKLKNRYDYAIAFSHNDNSSYYVIDKVRAAKKVMFYHNGIYESCEKVKKLNKKYYPKFDTIFAVSDSCRNELLKHFPTLTDKIKVKYNEIDDNEIKRLAEEPIDLSKSSLDIVTVARISPEKGIEIAISAAEKLYKKGINFRWYFVGDGYMATEIQKDIDNKNLSDCCFLLGAKENPYPYMKFADIYVQPSLVESFGLTVAEAKVLNKRIVATNLSEIVKQLSEYSNGIIVETNSDSICKGILSFVE